MTPELNRKENADAPAHLGRANKIEGDTVAAQGSVHGRHGSLVERHHRRRDHVVEYERAVFLNFKRVSNELGDLDPVELDEEVKVREARVSARVAVLGDDGDS